MITCPALRKQLEDKTGPIPPHQRSCLVDQVAFIDIGSHIDSEGFSLRTSELIVLMVITFGLALDSITALLREVNVR